MEELDHLPPALEAALAGADFRRRRRLVLPLLTMDPEGYPRAALLTPAEVRANSPRQLAVAVRGASRTAANLLRRRRATLLYLHRDLTAFVQTRAGRARVCEHDPERHIVPLSVFRVSLDRPEVREGAVALIASPTFGGADAGLLFSREIFEELARPTR